MFTDQIFFATTNGFKNAEKEYKLLEESIHFKKKEATKLLDSEKTDPTCGSLHEELQFLCKRAAQLKNYLKKGCMVKTIRNKTDKNIVTMGSAVFVEVNGKQKDKMTIVGTTEINPSSGFISNHSPMGKALLGRTLGEVVSFNQNQYKILDIQ